MAEEVGNLRVRLGLTGTEFTSQLATVNRELNNFGATLREQATRTGGFGQSLEGLEAKSRALTAQMALQRQKIELLNTALRDAVSRHGEFSREAQVLRGRVTNANTALNRMQGQLDTTTQSMTDLSNSSGDASSNLGGMNVTSIADDMKGLALTAGAAALSLAAIGAAAVVAGIVKSVQVSDELKRALNGVQAEANIADEEMAGMKETMLEIYNNNFGENFEEIGKAMTFIYQQTGLLGDELKEVTQNAFAMRDTFGIEVEESIKAVDIMMKNFGITSEEAMNLLAQGAQEGLNKNGDLADIIAEYGPHFATLGITAEDMFNILNNGAAAGIFSLDQLGDAVHEFGIRGKDGSDETAKAFKSLGLDAEKTTADIAAGGEKASGAFTLVTNKLNDMKDPQAKYAAGVALFGTMWEEVQSKGMKALTDTTKEIDKSRDALSKINDVKYDSFSEAMTGIGRNIETAILIPIGDELLPILQEFADYIILHMPEIKEAIKVAMAEGIKNFREITAEIKLYWDVLTGLIDFFKGVFTADWETAWSGITKIFSASLGSMDEETQEKAAKMQEDFTKAWDAIKEGMNTFFSETIPMIGEKLNQWGDAIGTWYDNTKSAITSKLNAWKSTISSWYDTTKSTITTKLNAWKSTISSWYDNTKSAITSKLNAWKSTITSWYDTTKSTITTKLNAWKSTISSWYDTTKAAITSKLNAWKSTITSWYDTTKSAITTKLNAWKSTITSWYDNAKAAIISKLSAWKSSILSWYDTTRSNIISKLSSWKSSITNWFNGIPSTITSLLSKWKNAVVTWFSTMVSTIKTKLNNWKAEFAKIDLYKIGSNVIQGLIDGVASKVTTLMSKAKEIATSVTSTIQNAFQIQSPSKVMEGIGKDIVKGLVVGIHKTKEEAEKAAKELVEGIQKQFEDVDELFMKESVKLMTDFEEAKLKVTKDFGEDKAKLQKELIDGYKEILKESRKAIEKEEEVYTKAMLSKEKALYSFAGIFDEIAERQELTGIQLKKNLEAQVFEFQVWQHQIKILVSKGLDEGVVNELREMGPRAAAQINALTQLTSEELSEYSDLWALKHKLAKDESISQLEGLREATDENIRGIKTDAAKNLNILVNTFHDNMDEINLQMRTDLFELTKNVGIEIRKLVVITQTTMQSMVKNSKIIGTDMMNGLINSMNAQKGKLIQAARSIADTIASTLRNSLQIKSPSKVMVDIGTNVTDGLTDGIKLKQNMVINAMEGVSTSIKTGAQTGMSNLTNAIRGSSNENISINLVVDGKTLANVMAPHQHALQRSYSRGVGIA